MHSASRLLNITTLAMLALSSTELIAAEFEFGGDARYYQFYALDDLPDQRQDTELGILRLKLDTTLNDEFSIETHATLQLQAPSSASGSSIATGNTRRYWDLEANLVDKDNLLVSTELDRFNLRWEHKDFNLVAGRQAITWGVNYFWPVLDLFAPFAPQRIDRDYKPGVDAVRITVPLGDFSEVEIVTAGQGDNMPEDLSYAALGRWNVANSDVALMIGSFHEDTVIGGFFTTDYAGVGYRLEIAHTDSGDDLDKLIDRESFWRATAGIDYQINAEITWVTELAWNEYGSKNSAEYLPIIMSDRFSRGEITSFGRAYIGSSLNWQLHPLMNASIAVLHNIYDHSTLIQPGVNWSLSDNTEILFGVIAGFGDELDHNNQLQSEYGAAPLTLWAAIKTYF